MTKSAICLKDNSDGSRPAALKSTKNQIKDAGYCMQFMKLETKYGPTTRLFRSATQKESLSSVEKNFSEFYGQNLREMSLFLEKSLIPGTFEIIHVGSIRLSKK